MDDEDNQDSLGAYQLQTNQSTAKNSQMDIERDTSNKKPQMSASQAKTPAQTPKFGK